MNLTRVSALAAGLLLASAMPAQERSYDQEEMKANYQELLETEWFKNGGWTDDFDAAKAAAKKSGKPIFTYFTRTYAF